MGLGLSSVSKTTGSELFWVVETTGSELFLTTKQRGQDFFIHSKQRGHDFFGASKNPTARPRFPINFDNPIPDTSSNLPPRENDRLYSSHWIIYLILWFLIRHELFVHWLTGLLFGSKSSAKPWVTMYLTHGLTYTYKCFKKGSRSAWTLANCKQN